MRPFLFLLLFFSFEQANAQEPFFYSITKTNGLPSNSVYDIYQDSKGFMWFATDKGICRYDGTDFILYTSDLQTSKAGSNINEDKFGRIWYCNFDGFLYYLENGIIKNIEQPKTIGYIKYGIINDDLYLVQPDSVYIYDLKSLKKVHAIYLPDKYITTAYTTNDMFYVLGDYLHCFGNKKLLNSSNFSYAIKDKFRAPMLQGTSDRLVVTSKFSNDYFIISNDKVTKASFSAMQNVIQNICMIDGNLWLCTPSGLVNYNKEGKKVQQLFIKENISNIFKGRDNNLWVSTLTNGVMLIPNVDDVFYPLSPKPTVLTTLGKEIIIGTDKEMIYSFSPKTKMYRKIFENNSNHPISQLFVDETTKNILFTSSVFRIINEKGKIKYELSAAVKDIEKIDDRFYAYAASGQNCLLEMNKDAKTIWGNLLTPKVENDRRNTYSFASTINGKSIAFNKTNNSIYLASNTGLFAITPNDKRNITLSNKPFYTSSLQAYGADVYALSTNEQLFKIDSENQLTPFTIPQISNMRFSKFKIANNNLFLFTKNEILKYNLINKILTSVLPTSNELEVSDLTMVDSVMYFLTSKGLLVKNISHLSSAAKPKLVLNYLKINEQFQDFAKPINLPYGDYEIKINFSTLSFVPNEKNEVVYRINNKTWNKLNADNKTIVLSSFSPGNYHIELKLDRNDSPITQHIYLKIKKPFWQSPFSIITILLILSFLIWILYKRKISNLNKKNQLLIDNINLEKNINESKLKAIKSQMNPHFFYNALNTIQSYVLANDKMQAVKYLSKFSSLTRTILEMSDKDLVTLSEEIATITLYLDIEKVRFDEDFTYSISINNITDTNQIKIPSMLLQPYIENAIKHGLLHKKGKKELTISFAKQEECLQIIIDDNGIGMEKSMALKKIKNKTHKSFATKAIQTRIELLNKNIQQKITVENINKVNQTQQSLGTIIKILIPILAND